MFVERGFHVKLLPNAITSSSPEYTAIVAGVRAGDAALASFRSSGVIKLFTEVRQFGSMTPMLVALRTYAELRRVLLFQGYDVPATSLVAEGFTAAQIACFNRTIASIPSATAQYLSREEARTSEIVQ
jgi:hypothetical protein